MKDKAQKKETGTQYLSGDVAKVIKNLSGHQFEIGTIITVQKKVSDGHLCKDKDGHEWYLTSKELREILPE